MFKNANDVIQLTNQWNKCTIQLLNNTIIINQLGWLINLVHKKPREFTIACDQLTKILVIDAQKRRIVTFITDQVIDEHYKILDLLYLPQSIVLEYQDEYQRISQFINHLVTLNKKLVITYLNHVKSA